MDSFSSYHINKGDNTHSLKMKSQKPQNLMSAGDIQAGKWLKEKDATLSISSKIHILITCGWIPGKWAVGEVILRPFSVELFVTIAMVVF